MLPLAKDAKDFANHDKKEWLLDFHRMNIANKIISLSHKGQTRCRYYFEESDRNIPIIIDELESKGYEVTKLVGRLIIDWSK